MFNNPPRVGAAWSAWTNFERKARWKEYFADLANNSTSWQWVAGCGVDAAPYFRIFNPTEQLKKFDKELKYTKKPSICGDWERGKPPSVAILRTVVFLIFAFIAYFLGDFHKIK